MTNANNLVQPKATRLPMHRVLQANAVIALVVGVLLLAAPWSELYEHLNDFRPAPWIYAQLAGATLFGLAWILWRASNDERGRTLVAQGAAITNLIGFVCIAIWLFSDDTGIPSSGSFGSWAFDVFAVVIVTLGVLEARAFRTPRP